VTGNLGNGSTAKMVRTDVGEVRIGVPRDCAGTFAPRVVPKHARRLAGFDEAVLSLYAKGMTTGDIANQLADIYCTEVSVPGFGLTGDRRGHRRCAGLAIASA
jgi:putative transposase